MVLHFLRYFLFFSAKHFFFLLSAHILSAFDFPSPPIFHSGNGSVYTSAFLFLESSVTHQLLTVWNSLWRFQQNCNKTISPRTTTSRMQIKPSPGDFCQSIFLCITYKHRVPLYSLEVEWLSLVLSSVSSMIQLWVGPQVHVVGVRRWFFVM